MNVDDRLKFAAEPAANLGLGELADLLTRGFEGYFVDLRFDKAMLGRMLRNDAVDLDASRIVLESDRPVAVALVARRGRESRIAAMGVVAESRGSGAGRWLMESLIELARARGEQRMVLEVIEQNIPAVRLYQSLGFRTVRRLAGFRAERIAPDQQNNRSGGDSFMLQELDTRDVARAMIRCGITDLPWQISPETLMQMALPTRACRLDCASAVISDPARESITIWSLFVEPEAQRRGRATALIRALGQAFPGKSWRVPVLADERATGLFERLGFVRESLTQLQMELDLLDVNGLFVSTSKGAGVP